MGQFAGETIQVPEVQPLDLPLLDEGADSGERGPVQAHPRVVFLENAASGMSSPCFCAQARHCFT